MREYDLVCIGCGPAGEKAATQAGYFGYQVAIVEREGCPGGAMVNTGTIASKALRETALLCSAFRRRPLPGLEYMVNRELSVTKLMAQRYRVQYQEHDRIESSIDREQIDVHRGRGRIADAHTVSVEGVDGQTTTLKAKFILIATGSSPVRPEHIPFDHPSVVDADGILELTAIPSSMLVVGGGVIGCEYACMFSEIGVKVTLVDPRQGLLPFLDPECRDHLLRAMTDEGIDVRLNASVKTVKSLGDESVSAELDDGDEIRCDVLLWSAGRSSNTQDIGLDQVKIKTGQRGLVIVNEHYQTNVPSVYAAGDVIGFPALASTSMEQGRVAACHMFGIEFKKKLADTLPIGLYTIPAISMVGMTEQQAAEAGREFVVGRALYRYNVRGRMLGDEEGIVKCVFDRRSRRLLGTTIVGQDATELIHLAQFAITSDAGIDYFINACFNYPSLAELYKYAAYDALQAIAGHQGRRQPQSRDQAA
ncbi:MAG: Si-specific NAD(P)(+) transhydrogenase [Planctomycetota bacterium]|nr:Si-specific NAD(P)(+) transhydrogenase [Planctomycetota bacterium]